MLEEEGEGGLESDLAVLLYIPSQSEFEEAVRSRYPLSFEAVEEAFSELGNVGTRNNYLKAVNLIQIIYKEKESGVKISDNDFGIIDILIENDDQFRDNLPPTSSPTFMEKVFELDEGASAELQLAAIRKLPATDQYPVQIPMVQWFIMHYVLKLQEKLLFRIYSNMVALLFDLPDTDPKIKEETHRILKALVQVRNKYNLWWQLPSELFVMREAAKQRQLKWKKEEDAYFRTIPTTPAVQPPVVVVQPPPTPPVVPVVPAPSPAVLPAPKPSAKKKKVLTPEQEEEKKFRAKFDKSLPSAERTGIVRGAKQKRDYKIPKDKKKLVQETLDAFYNYAKRRFGTSTYLVSVLMGKEMIGVRTALIEAVDKEYNLAARNLKKLLRKLAKGTAKDVRIFCQLLFISMVQDESRIRNIFTHIPRITGPIARIVQEFNKQYPELNYVPSAEQMPIPSKKEVPTAPVPTGPPPPSKPTEPTPAIVPTPPTTPTPPVVPEPEKARTASQLFEKLLQEGIATQLTYKEMREALRQEYINKFGAAPTEEELDKLMASYPKPESQKAELPKVEPEEPKAAVRKREDWLEQFSQLATVFNTITNKNIPVVAESEIPTVPNLSRVQGDLSIITDLYTKFFNREQEPDDWETIIDNIELRGIDERIIRLLLQLAILMANPPALGSEEKKPEKRRKTENGNVDAPVRGGHTPTTGRRPSSGMTRSARPAPLPRVLHPGYRGYHPHHSAAYYLPRLLAVAPVYSQFYCDYPGCGLPARFVCGQCHAAHYCSLEHQQLDAPYHLPICNRYYGRLL